MLIAVEKDSLCSPGGNDTESAGYRLQEEVVILFANGIGDFQQIRGISGFVGEEVHHFQHTKVPAMGKGETTSDSGIIFQRISSTWIEHDEGEAWMVRRP